ncbi:FAD-binding protein [Vibrio sp. WJH972]
MNNTNTTYKEYTTDILVIGSGYAGTFAAIKAKEQGFDVLVVDKGRAGMGGKTPWAVGFQVFDPKSGQPREHTIQSTARDSDYLVRRDIVEMWHEDSLDRYREMADWGAVDRPDGDKNQGDVFRKKLRENDVKLLEKVTIVDLIEKDGQVVGAIGFFNQREQAVVIKAKSVILCTGAGSFKVPGYPIGALTHDGQAMAYRLGAEISGKENVDPHETKKRHLCHPWGAFGPEFELTLMVKFDAFPPPFVDGKPIIDGVAPSDNPDYVPLDPDFRPPRPPFPMIGGDDMTYAAMRGDVPVTPEVMFGSKGQKGPHILDEDEELYFAATSGMAQHRFDGIFTKIGSHQAGVNGLYAAGDSTYSAINGLGVSSCGSTVQGARAGNEASEYIKGLSTLPEVSDDEIQQKIDAAFAPLKRERGYSPTWVTQYLQHIMTPYFVLYAKRKETLEAAIMNIEYLQQSVLPKMKASNSHELRLVHETINMVLNAEMKLRASLFRDESRGSHYREDIPARNDQDWLAWVIISQENGVMKCTKRPIPEEWKPDLSKPYEELHQARFPGEMEYLASKESA